MGVFLSTEYFLKDGSGADNTFLLFDYFKNKLIYILLN